MKSMLARLVFLAAMIPLAALAQQREVIPGTEQTFGHWHLAAWKEGGRSGCTISVNYRSGVEMSFVLEGDQWRIGWWHPNWRYADGQTIAVTFWIDGSPPQTVNADRVGGGKEPWLRAVLPDSPDLFDQFRFGNKLHLRVPGGASYTFNLTATSAALAALRSCATRYRGTQAPPAPAASGPRRDGPVIYTLPALTPDQRVEAIRLAANLLTRMPGFRILNEEEQKTLDKTVARLEAAVVWRSEDIVGLLHLIPDAKDEDIPRLASSLIGANSQQCKGRYSLSMEPDVRSATVRRIHSSCTEGAAGTTTRIILMPFGKSGVYLFLTSGEQENSAAVARAEELLRNALFEIVKK